MKSKVRAGITIADRNKNENQEPAPAEASAKRARREVRAVASSKKTTESSARFKNKWERHEHRVEVEVFALADVFVVSGVGAPVAAEGVKDASRHLCKACHFRRFIIIRNCSMRGLGIPRVVLCERLTSPHIKGHLHRILSDSHRSHAARLL